MPNYIVNRRPQFPSGDHEVHDKASTRGCLPDWSNRYELGYFDDCSGAVRAAKSSGFRTANGCAYCAPACHTS